MKPQDIVFVIVFSVLLYVRNSRILTIAGLLCLILAIPLFQYWIFFTAERLVMYAAAFLFVSVLLNFTQIVKKEDI